MLSAFGMQNNRPPTLSRVCCLMVGRSARKRCCATHVHAAWMDQPPTVQSEGQTPPNAMTSSKERPVSRGEREQQATASQGHYWVATVGRSNLAVSSSRSYVGRVSLISRLVTHLHRVQLRVRTIRPTTDVYQAVNHCCARACSRGPHPSSLAPCRSPGLENEHRVDWLEHVRLSANGVDFVVDLHTREAESRRRQAWVRRPLFGCWAVPFNASGGHFHWQRGCRG